MTCLGSSAATCSEPAAEGRLWCDVHDAENLAAFGTPPPSAPPVPPHGSPWTYSNGCRCEPCRVAFSRYCRDLRERRRSQPLPDHIRHGLASTYRQWGCRCRVCCEANTESLREWRARKAA